MKTSSTCRMCGKTVSLREPYYEVHPLWVDKKIIGTVYCSHEHLIKAYEKHGNKQYKERRKS